VESEIVRKRKSKEKYAWLRVSQELQRMYERNGAQQSMSIKSEKGRVYTSVGGYGDAAIKDIKD
jgi:hypothetical protein